MFSSSSSDEGLAPNSSQTDVPRSCPDHPEQGSMSTLHPPNTRNTYCARLICVVSNYLVAQRSLPQISQMIRFIRLWPSMVLIPTSLGGKRLSAFQTAQQMPCVFHSGMIQPSYGATQLSFAVTARVTWISVVDILMYALTFFYRCSVKAISGTWYFPIFFGCLLFTWDRRNFSHVNKRWQCGQRKNWPHRLNAMFFSFLLCIHHHPQLSARFF